MSEKLGRHQLFSVLSSANFHLVLTICSAVLLFPTQGSRRGPPEIEIQIGEIEDERAPVQDIQMSTDETGIAQVNQAFADEQAELEEETPTEDEIDNLAAEGEDDARQLSSTRPLGGRSGESVSGAQFFGMDATGDHFVYVLDVSGSMNSESESGNGKSRFQTASTELMRSIDQLKRHQWFYVMLFSYRTQFMFLEDKPDRLQMVQATWENKRKVYEWLRQIKPSGGTDPCEALEYGLKLKPNAVFFLSDGEFNDAAAVERTIVTSNVAGAPIHSFAYENADSCVHMRLVAQLTGGSYRFISKDVDVATAMYEKEIRRPPWEKVDK